MLGTIRNDTLNLLNMQQQNYENIQFDKSTAASI